MTFTNDPPIITDLSVIPGTDEKADLNAPAGSGGKLVIGQAPNITITETNVVADAAERLALDVQEGDVAIQTNVSTSFIFTGGDNVANNWQTLDFDAVGAIAGEDIAPGDVTASGNMSMQDLTVAGAINGADTSAAAAGETLTSDGNGGFSFASSAGFEIDVASSVSGLPSPEAPQIGYVVPTNKYYLSKNNAFQAEEYAYTNDRFNLPSRGAFPSTMTWNGDGTEFTVNFVNAGSNNTEIFEVFACSTPYDITTASSDRTFNFTTRPVNPETAVFDDTGDTIVIGGNSRIEQFNLGTPYDITTIDQNGFGVDGFHARSFQWFENGSKIIWSGEGGDDYEVYDLATPYDISTRGSPIVNINNGPQHQDIQYNQDGTLALLLKNDGRIQTYSLSVPYDPSTLQFTGSELQANMTSDTNTITFRPNYESDTEFWILDRFYRIDAYEGGANAWQEIGQF